MSGTPDARLVGKSRKMPKLAIDLGTALLLILPGFLAYRFSVMQRVDPSRRSAVWQVSEILEHSFYVHLLGIALVAAVHAALGGSTHISHLVTRGPQTFLELYFDEAVRWYVGYSLYMILASVVIGAYSLPAKVSEGIIASLGRVLRIWPFRWIPKPGDVQPQEPAWHQAFRSMVEAEANDGDPEYRSPIVFVRMKDSGDVYVGEIAAYPIALDTQSEKDFLITRSRYYRSGDFNDRLDLASFDGIGAVLLNSRDVESVRVIYRRDEDD